MKKEKILVLCTGNSARSQMGEGLFRAEGGEGFQVYSAGTKPSSVRPEAIAVMKEIGIDISGRRSKHVDEFKGQKMDYVITVCDNAKESCPIFPGAAKVVHWPFPDPPHGQVENEVVLGEFRRVRDMIVAKFKDFKAFENPLKLS